MTTLGLSAFLALLIGAQGPTETAPTFDVATPDESLRGVQLEGLDSDFILRIGGSRRQMLTPAKWLSLRQNEQALPPVPAPPFLLLSGGERLPLALPPDLRLADERLQAALAPPVETAARGPLAVPQAALTAICLALPTGVESIERLLADATRPRDVLILHNGDRFEGSLTRLDRRGGALARPTGTTEVLLERLAVVT